MMQVIKNARHIVYLTRLFKIEKYKEYNTLEWTRLFISLFPVSVYPEYRNQVLLEQDITTLFYSINS